ncbi:MAG: sugar ABC transporter ATP-binding protein [Clostridiales Family XIII bacterium]|jgi:ABC-type sugar transport system ATPase subunit|nr:sugar ABC transporter ATP-binding protein [Clostridiales Family XIII bacterium]
MQGISKSFFKNKVLDNVHLKVKEGSVHALMGENGAGKSTLMKILAGVYKADSGEIFIDGQKVEILSPTAAQKLGIAMIHQELSALPEMTVAENIFLSREPGKLGLVDYKKMHEDTAVLMKTLKIDISSKKKMKELRVADQQMVEIAKAISLDARIIIMDEPTSAITDKEVDTLFEIIRSLTKQGKSIIYISHKMDEVFKICDEITILRDGSFIGTWPASELDDASLIKQMVGRELKDVFPKVDVPIGDNLIEIKNLSCHNQFEDISFNVRKGEILGVAGLVGSGRTEVMQTIFGLAPSDEGQIIFEGKVLNTKTPTDAIKHGIAFVTEDRKKEGIIPDMGVGQNVTLPFMSQFCSKFINQYLGFIVDRRKEADTIEKQIKALGIKTKSSKQTIASLSGGNQQKVILAKWLTGDPSVLILDEPTRGIDVGAKAEIYKLMCEFVSRGKAIIMVSSEMPEVMGMSDRIIVMSNRKLGGELNRSEFSQERIMDLAVSHL